MGSLFVDINILKTICENTYGKNVLLLVGVAHAHRLLNILKTSHIIKPAGIVIDVFEFASSENERTSLFKSFIQKF